MLKLLVFELQKKWKVLLGAFGLYELANLILAVYLTSSGRIKTSDEYIAFIFLLATCFWFAAIVDCINNLRLEAKRSTRDLYFSLPYSGFTKIGSKLILSTVVMTLASGIAAVTTLFTTEKLLNEPVFTEALKFMQMNLGNTSYILIASIFQIIFFIAMVYLSFAIYRAFFSQLKFGGFITFMIYLAINYLYFKLVGGLEVTGNDTTFMTMSLWKTEWLELAVVGLSIMASYGITGYLFEKKANFD
ncbi:MULTISPECIES: hypothetical protein [unclassified Fusibacter]|uniref:hypothetical protein n=1 Tax=unclassified Fusibacter TaxID=2624464 RepID=UPI0010125FD9|nr:MULTISPECIES: hypothetical protein [unclassified Fusibacter]MCK8060145.1 hypothetical protein [Fusibacter sp. A2]NPE22287.1 hypothetical protein [Fusibacter sp. A1]RXV61060.1 hypothetical protein DWB64_10605 [Fusibacter sp. A1]